MIREDRKIVSATIYDRRHHYPWHDGDFLLVLDVHKYAVSSSWLPADCAHMVVTSAGVVETLHHQQHHSGRVAEVIKNL